VTSTWTIYYADGTTVSGSSEAEWTAAPGTGVQVVVLWEEPPVEERPWRLVRDRYLWTGTDEYDPFGWGAKEGSLLPDEEYAAIAELAFYGPVPV
jgi:hypothetical protein